MKSINQILLRNKFTRRALKLFIERFNYSVNVSGSLSETYSLYVISKSYPVMVIKLKNYSHSPKIWREYN